VFSATALVIYKTPLRRTGDDHPCPLIGVFQATFSEADHFRGSLFAVLIPSPVGPRKLAQSAAWVDGTSITNITNAEKAAIAG
jgi:hypothetical protein